MIGLSPTRFLYMFFAVLTVITSTAMADVEIQEVQVVYGLNGQPETLVIYGTDFGTAVPGPPGIGKPIVYFGTQDPPLTISANQFACDYAVNLPPAPLETLGTDCVVADVPPGSPNGDYLLLLEGTVADVSCEVDGKPAELLFTYTGDNCSASTYDPSGSLKHTCIDLSGLGTSINIEPTGRDASKFIIDPVSGISIGETFTVTSTTLGANLSNNFDLDVFSNGQLG
jgi:hypothetical protein